MQLGFYPANGLNPVTGYGKCEAGLYRGLIQAGIDITQAAPITLLVGNPRWVAKIRRRRIWLYTMSESTRVSGEWVEIINRRAERVLLPCPDLVDVYRESGVKVPCHFVGCGVDMSPPSYTERRANPKQFTFLAYSYNDMRKGAQFAVLAFMKLFKGDSRFNLVVKCRSRQSWLTNCKEPQLKVVAGEISEGRWHALLKQAHCFIFPSFAEGFGLPPREAALAGVPTIATQWLGMWDVDQWGYPIPVREMLPAQYGQKDQANAEDALWAQPDIDALEGVMQYVVDHYTEALNKARAGREYLLANFSYRCVAERIKGLVNEYA
jgi:glycosyltransferase involved in cell wall biosynthesis